MASSKSHKSTKMIKNDPIRQRQHFDKTDNQYKHILLTSPATHTKLELNEIISRLPQPSGDLWVVDFAAGSGRVTIPLLQKEYKVLAVDISKNSLKVITDMAGQLGLKKLITRTTLPQGKISVIVGADALHHVDMDKYLPLFHQKLSKGGKIVFSEPCAGNIAWYIYLWLFHDWEIEKGMLNFRYYKILSILKKYGFRNIKINGLGFFPRPFLSWSLVLCRFNDWLGSLPILKHFAYRYIIEAYK